MWKKILFVLIVLILVELVCQASCFSDVKAATSFLPRLDLIKGSGPEVFVLERGTRHWIPDVETFNYLNFKWGNIKTYSDAILEDYPQGNNWSSNEDYPDGTLLRGSDGKVYLIELNKRRWIPSPAVFELSNFGWKYILDIDDDVLDNYDLGDDLTWNEPNRYPNTVVVDGPYQGEVIDTAEIEFRYSGTNPLGLVEDLNFETYLKGYDDDWDNQGSDYTQNYDIEDLTGSSFTFYVRAKNEQGYYDSTPASRSFQLGVSSNYHKIEISDIGYDEDDFKTDYIILRNVSDEDINLADWAIQTNSANISIPQITLKPNEELVAMSGNSPSGGNFLVNKCSGYLDDGDFNPSLDNDCPWPSSSDYSHFIEYCRDFIGGLDRCETADYAGNIDVSGNSECTSYLNQTFNYSSCYSAYHLDPDFYGDEWRIFFNYTSRDIFSNLSDTVILYDSNGLKVDEYYYD